MGIYARRPGDPPVSVATLQRVVGALGMALPFVVAVGYALRPCECGGLTPPCPLLKSSISVYYGTCVRDYFVGILFVVGWFLFAYKGTEPKDDRAGDLACVFALGVALFPTTSASQMVRILHLICGAGMFAVLAYFSYFLFTKDDEPATPEKQTRNKVYRACGVIIFGCLVLMGICKAILDDDMIAGIYPVFWLETVALWAFGFSWFVKGETFWRNAPELRSS